MKHAFHAPLFSTFSAWPAFFLSPHTCRGFPALSAGARSCGVHLARPGVRVPFCTSADVSVGAPLFVTLTDLEALGGQGCTSRGPDLLAPHPLSPSCRSPGSEKIRRGLTPLLGSPLEGLWVSWTKHRRLRVTPPVLLVPWAASVQGPLGSEVHRTRRAPARRLALRPHGGASDVRPRPAWREVSARPRRRPTCGLWAPRRGGAVQQGA